ncbi:MAG: TetR/AcrR family transcriptional regulator [Methylocella sp.]
MARKMAHPLSEDKRTAILEAAAEVVATLGVSAPTAKIAKGAGVADGTLFTYFANKDELLNQLYLELKTDLRDAMMTGYPAGKGLIDRNRHVWDRFIDWGSAHPLKRRAMRQLAVSDRITEESKKLVRDAFEEFDDMMRECAARGAMRHQPPSFVSAIMSAIGDTTMDFIVREPAQAKRYKKAGFDAFWNAVAG